VRLHARIAPDHLRRLPESPQEGAAHAVGVGKAGLPCDRVDRMRALLHHRAPLAGDWPVSAWNARAAF